MTSAIHITAFEWLFFGYFIVGYGVYAALNLFAILRLRQYLQIADIAAAENVFSRLDMPISIVMPAFNEAVSIVMSTRALLQLEYPDYEVVVVNDGSRDDTLQKLIDSFELRPFPEAYRKQLPCRPVRGIYASARFPNLRVIDKENGGSKADAMNAGINACRFPLFCAVDADSILQSDSLRRAVRPFLEEPDTIATGGTVRIANGCSVRDGFLENVNLPSRWLPLFQVVEYLRAFLFGRLGWTQMNALLIVSGAFGIFRKDAVVEVGGYNGDAIGEDMELVMRLHRHYLGAGRRYRITFVPDPVCWTDAPEDFATLASQRVRWQLGLAQCLSWHKDLFFRRRGGTVSWVAMPFFLIFEMFGPLVEVAGYVFVAVAALLDWISWINAGIFFGLAVGLGVMLSTTALVLEEMSFRVYPRFTDLLKLFVAAIGENLGYRQLTLVWRIQGLYRWATNSLPEWGNMKRSASLEER